MKKAFSILIVPVLLLCINARAQQRMQFTQYMINPYILNPAAGGTGADLDLTVSYRKQWVNFNGGPVTYYFSGHLPIREQKKQEKRMKASAFHSAGAFVARDITGPISKSTFMASYSFNIPVVRDYRLALGLSAGATQVRMDQSQLKFDQPGEQLSYTSRTVPDASAGLWFYNKRMYAGASASQILSGNLTVFSSYTSLVYHYYTTAGYKIPLGYPGENGNYNFYLVPSVMVKYGSRRTTPSIDLNLKANYRENYWAGISYRHRDSFSMLAGIRFKLKNGGILEPAYSYDYTLSGITTYTTGSHEITLKYYYTYKKLICPSRFW